MWDFCPLGRRGFESGDNVVPEMSWWTGPLELYIYRGHAVCCNPFPPCSLSVVSVLRSPVSLEANRMTAPTPREHGIADRVGTSATLT